MLPRDTLTGCTPLRKGWQVIVILSLRQSRRPLEGSANLQVSCQDPSVRPRRTRSTDALDMHSSRSSLHPGIVLVLVHSLSLDALDSFWTSNHCGVGKRTVDGMSRSGI